jgi:multidrug efflux pump subunit AcrA (membrane-fusion protein)
MVVPDPDSRLRAGMIAEVALVRGVAEQAIVLPLAAVVPHKGDYVVFVVEDGHAVRRLVRIDSFVGHEAVIRSGLSAGERVVIEGQRTLQDGMPVDTR